MGFQSQNSKWLIQALILSGLPLAIWSIPKVNVFFPLVVLQLLIGILAGPSVMGLLWPDFENWLFSADVVLGLTALAFYGVLFFVFYTGLHIEKDMFFGPRATLEFWVMAFSSMLCPFSIGCLLGWLFVDVFFDSSVIGSAGTKVTYILSCGVSIGITALPVLSAILIEVGQLGSDLGIMMIACATVHDVLLWLMITLILGLSNTPDNWCGPYQPLASVGLYCALVIFLALVYAPLMGRLIKTRWWRKLSTVPRLGFTLCCMYFCSAVTDALQIHTLPGAVAFGAMVPVLEKPFVMGHIDVLNRVLFLPLFFGSSGLQVKLNQAKLRTLYIFLALTGGAFVGHVPGSLLVAKLFRRSWKQAAIVSTCMVCKGGVEIVVATLLFTRNITGLETFCGMMLMALACTVVTKPFLLLIQKYFPGEGDPFSLGVPKGPIAVPTHEVESDVTELPNVSAVPVKPTPEAAESSAPPQLASSLIGLAYSAVDLPVAPSMPRYNSMVDPYDTPNPYSFLLPDPSPVVSAETPLDETKVE